MRNSRGFSQICRVRAAEEKSDMGGTVVRFQIKRKGIKYVMISRDRSACVLDPCGHPFTSRPYRTYRKVLRALHRTEQPEFIW